MQVEVRNNDFEFALRILRNKVVKSGIERELKQRQYFISKSERKREKARRSMRRMRRAERKAEQHMMRSTG